MKLKIVSLLLLFKVQSDVAAQPSASNFEPEINYYRHADDTTKFLHNPSYF
ncbi:MAG: hypothetical protein IPQ11_16625 [Bacteroidetes bacterium]|nr:hypothetical protein [Bacteroidota bacterium]